MAKVSVEDLFGLTNFSFTVDLPGDMEIDVTAVDPKSPAVLVQYFEDKEDPKVGDKKAMKNLWRDCKVQPPELVESFDDLPTSVQIGVTANLTERLGEDHFFRARSKL